MKEAVLYARRRWRMVDDSSHIKQAFPSALFQVTSGRIWPSFSLFPRRHLAREGRRSPRSGPYFSTSRDVVQSLQLHHCRILMVEIRRQDCSTCVFCWSLQQEHDLMSDMF